MIAPICFVLAVQTSPFKSKSRLEAENAVLRHQLIVLRRKVRGRARLSNNDRWFFVQLYRWFPSILKVLTIVQPETLVRWHRDGRHVVVADGICESIIPDYSYAAPIAFGDRTLISLIAVPANACADVG